MVVVLGRELAPSGRGCAPTACCTVGKGSRGPQQPGKSLSQGLVFGNELLISPIWVEEAALCAPAIPGSGGHTALKCEAASLALQGVKRELTIS